MNEDDWEELQESKRRHPSSKPNPVEDEIEVGSFAISGWDPRETPGRWRRSVVDGYCWFEPALFDAELGVDTGGGDGVSSS